MQEAERLLGDVSLHCNLDIINKKISDLAEEQQQTVHRGPVFLPRCLSVGNADVLSDRSRPSQSCRPAFSSAQMSKMSP